MATKTRNISLPPSLDDFVERRAQSGLYGNARAVLPAGWRALHREEMGTAWREWQATKAKLPQDPITSASEQEVVEAVCQSRRAGQRKAAK